MSIKEIMAKRENYQTVNSSTVPNYVLEQDLEDAYDATDEAMAEMEDLIVATNLIEMEDGYYDAESLVIAIGALGAKMIAGIIAAIAAVIALIVGFLNGGSSGGNGSGGSGGSSSSSRRIIANITFTVDTGGKMWYLKDDGIKLHDKCLGICSVAIGKFQKMAMELEGTTSNPLALLKKTKKAVSDTTKDITKSLSNTIGIDIEKDREAVLETLHKVWYRKVSKDITVKMSDLKAYMVLRDDATETNNRLKAMKKSLEEQQDLLKVYGDRLTKGEHDNPDMSSESREAIHIGRSILSTIKKFNGFSLWMAKSALSLSKERKAIFNKIIRTADRVAAEIDRKQGGGSNNNPEQELINSQLQHQQNMELQIQQQQQTVINQIHHNM